MSKPIRYFSRPANQWETEEVYGERSLRWIYGSRSGQWFLWMLVRRKIFSRLYGWLMNRPASRKKIQPFIDQYSINVEEMADTVADFKTFNEFFYRRLKPTARPMSSVREDIAFPADGRHFWVREVGQAQNLYAKGQVFDLASMVGSPELAEPWQGGSAVISRLCPVDYHRFHFPVSGEVVSRREIDGFYYSVNPWALAKNLGYLWENRREMVVMEVPTIGKVGFIAIGATCVGGIHWSHTVPRNVQKGDEAGFFSFGGSCIVTLWPKGAFSPSDDLQKVSLEGFELYAKMGDTQGQVTR